MFKKYFIISSIILPLILISVPKYALAGSAILYFSPSSKTLAAGESFWVDIMVNTSGQAVNAIAAYLDYPTDKLTPLGVDTAGSIMTMWAEKNASAGKIQIAGGLPTPGFSGAGKIVSVGFKARVSSGSVNLKFSSDSAVVTDVGNQNILNLTISGQGNYNFTSALTPSAPPASTKSPVVSISTTTQETTTGSLEVSQVLPEEKTPMSNIIIALSLFLVISFAIAVIWTFLGRFISKRG